jgi:hypothetical protein
MEIPFPKIFSIACPKCNGFLSSSEQLEKHLLFAHKKARVKAANQSNVGGEQEGNLGVHIGVEKVGDFGVPICIDQLQTFF